MARAPVVVASPEAGPVNAEPTDLVWSVVIPAYNEDRRVPVYLREVLAFFDGRGEPYEVIVVDDGSRDATLERVRELQALHPCVCVISLPENRGKGYAVRVGMVNARGTFRLFADADGATPIAELKRLEPALHEGTDIVIGSRVLGAPEVSVDARWHRVWVGRLFNWIVAWLGLRRIADSQCGFKCFRGPVADKLFRALATDGYGFDVELLLLAQRRRYAIAEVAVNWADQPGSKVKVLNDGPRMLWQILAARLALARGRYDR